jgi:hypothetical protein
MFAPTALDLKGLFRDPRMFDSARRWQEAGFAVEGEGRKSNIMVASHPSAPGYLFKKYSKKISQKKQLENFRRRIKGAEKLRAFIAAHQLSRIVVPGKYLHELPSNFARDDETAFVLVVEKMPLLTSSASKRMYRTLDNAGLEELCAVLVKFRGLDSGSRNIPFTDKGQMAFIDTERWNDNKKTALKRIREYLSSDQRAYAKKLFKTA